MSRTPSCKRRPVCVCFSASSSCTLCLLTTPVESSWLNSRVLCISCAGRGGLLKSTGATGMFHTMTTVKGPGADATTHMGHQGGVVGEPGKVFAHVSRCVFVYFSVLLCTLLYLLEARNRWQPHATEQLSFQETGEWMSDA